MDNPPRIPAVAHRHSNECKNQNEELAPPSRKENHNSHKIRVTVTTKTSNEVQNQVVYPLPRIPTSRALQKSNSVGSESGCSAQTQKTGTATTKVTMNLIKDGIECYNKGKYAHALRSFNSVLKSQMLRAVEDGNPLSAKVLANVGSVYLRQGRYQQAVESYDNAISHMRKLNRELETSKDNQIDFPLAGVLNNLGTAKFLQGDHQDSLQYYSEAMRYAKKCKTKSKSNKRDLATSLYNIGRISILRKDYSMALGMLNESLRLEIDLHGEKNIEIVDTLNLIGFVSYSTRLFDRAIFVFTEALSIVTAKYGSVHEKVAVSLMNVGMVMEKQGDLNEALRCFSTAQGVCKKVGLDENSETMQMATRSAKDIRIRISSLQDTEPSHRKKETRSKRMDSPEALCNQSKKSLPGRPKETFNDGSNNLCVEARDEEQCDMDEYAAFRGRRMTERAPVEYREDPQWEFDNSSIVE